jgi:hypothetical protein
VILLLVLSEGALATSTGRTGSSITGCKNCHGAAAAATTTASFGTAPLTVLPGEAVALTFTVSSTNVLRIAGGLNVSATGGTWTAGSNTQVLSGQITHFAPQSFTAGAVTFDFTWTAPATEGSYTLSGAGNAVNWNGTASGDGWDLAPSLVIEVDDGCDDLDSDGIDTCNGDCDDLDDTVYPLAPETCDGADDDCDDEIDEQAIDTTDWYLDSDGDGYGAGTPVPACEAPPQHVSAPGDCDNNDGTFHPGAPELDCSDPADYNCDGVTGFVDLDEDSWAACEECDDNNADIFPGAEEICDGADNDCNSTIDDGATDASAWYPDADGDGFGAGDPVFACAAPPDHVSNDEDCDDEDEDIHPDADEVCDPDDVDEDCDGAADDENAIDISSWFPDFDGDGFGSDPALVSCDQPAGFVAIAGDCDDLDVAINPGATAPECAATDFNCDGVIVPVDEDGDGWSSCLDCDDDAPATNPGAQEVCDGLDNDCDDTIDGPSSADALPFYADADLDGYGNPAQVTLACTIPPAHSFTGDDCDDGDPEVSPGATEIWYDGFDQNCDDLDDYDQDGDGSPVDEDCDDTIPWKYPGNEDLPYDGLDTNCDGSDDYDLDGDGHTASGIGDDCDDLDPAVFPGAPDPACDGIDLDCDPGPDTDPACADSVPEPEKGGCGCQTTTPGGWWGGLLLLGLALRARAARA